MSSDLSVYVCLISQDLTVLFLLPAGVLMWEIWTGGDMPYGKMRNPEVVERVCHGKEKLPKPSACPFNVYELMKECWRHVSQRIIIEAFVFQIDEEHDLL